MNAFTSFDPEQLDQPTLHRHLLAAIAPRPIGFASTIDALGNVNLSPYSFFNVFSSNPPTLIFSPARRGRDNSSKHSLENVQEVPEVVLNVVNYPMVEQMSLTSTEYEKGVNEFVKAGLTPVESSKVRPPRVGESPVAFECEVDQVIPLGNGPGAGNLILCKVVLLHAQNQYLNSGFPDTQKLDLVARMGANWYCRASGAALFEIPKPTGKKGIGVDQLPESVRNSTVLTGNDLGRLGTVEKRPESETIQALVQNEALQHQLRKEQNLNERQKLLHIYAKEVLHQGDTEQALSILLFADQIGLKREI